MSILLTSIRVRLPFTFDSSTLSGNAYTEFFEHFAAIAAHTLTVTNDDTARYSYIHGTFDDVKLHTVLDLVEALNTSLGEPIECQTWSTSQFHVFSRDHV